MTAWQRDIEVVCHADDAGALEMVRGAPHPSLAPHVMDYCGYGERTAMPMRRRQLPWPGVVLIFDFGPTLTFLDATGTQATARHATGFFGALTDTFVTMATAGAQSGLQVNLTPLGARRLIGVPMSELSNRVIGIDELFGRNGSRLREALAEAPGWPARFDLLDAVLARRLAAAAPVSPRVERAWRRLEASAGRIGIGALAGDLDCSRKHLAALFADQVGLPPKTIARIFRFHRAVQLAGTPEIAGWADLAAACGYADQAHFSNEFRRFAGATPSEFMATRMVVEHASMLV